MSKPGGRCDIPTKGQSVETPQPRAPIGEPSRSVAHYNRLELAPVNGVSPAATHSRHQPAPAEVRTSGKHDRQVIYASTKPWINSFLVHQGESCNKQVSGVTGLG